jgi:hypothetical protein
VTSAAGNVALAMLRREVDPGTEVSVAGTVATVESGAILPSSDTLSDGSG